MIGRIKETMFEESIYQDLIKEQYKKLYIVKHGKCLRNNMRIFDFTLMNGYEFSG